MNKAEFIKAIERFDDDTDMNEVFQLLEEDREQFIEELEERQHNSGMYVQQDLIALYRYER